MKRTHTKTGTERDKTVWSCRDWYLSALFPYRKGAAPAPPSCAKYAAGFIIRPLAAAAAAGWPGKRNGGGTKPPGAPEVGMPAAVAAAAAAATEDGGGCPGGGDVDAVLPDTVTVLSANISPRFGEERFR